MITAVIVTNAGVVSTLCASGLASAIIVGCHWFRGMASRMEQRRRA